ncbi:uncharacterized protein LOC117612626 [Prunus dulcis]|uniref:uncharacterized protein LOC117612626 n=1 Tax=Prunus dulcis TaxID=3755 RepID=UPI001481EDAE|nr:uncharacterized protein LOC117612626 [Prunus dulcis]
MTCYKEKNTHKIPANNILLEHFHQLTVAMRLKPPLPVLIFRQISDGENFAVRPPFEAPFLAKASSLPPLPSPPLFSDRKPGKRRWRRRENQSKLPTSPTTFPAISSCAVTWNRYSDHAYAASETLSGSSSVGLLPVVD